MGRDSRVWRKIATKDWQTNGTVSVRLPNGVLERVYLVIQLTLNALPSIDATLRSISEVSLTVDNTRTHTVRPVDLYDIENLTNGTPFSVASGNTRTVYLPFNFGIIGGSHRSDTLLDLRGVGSQAPQGVIRLKTGSPANLVAASSSVGVRALVYPYGVAAREAGAIRFQSQQAFTLLDGDSDPINILSGSPGTDLLGFGLFTDNANDERASLLDEVTLIVNKGGEQIVVIDALEAAQWQGLMARDRVTAANPNTLPTGAYYYSFLADNGRGGHKALANGALKVSEFESCVLNVKGTGVGKGVILLDRIDLEKAGYGTPESDG